MYPIAFTVFGKAIHFYGICIALGFLCGTGLLLWKKDRAGLTTEQVFDLCMLALFGGLIGARLLHVIQNWNSQKGLLWIIRVDQGGLVFYGGFILAVIAVCVYAKRKNISIPALLDVFAPAIAIGHAFGRLGCFMQGCCHGAKAPAGFPGAIRFPYMTGGSVDPKLFQADGYSCWLYPTQLWESAGNVILCVILLLIFRKFRKEGQIAGIYLILYAVMRFILEFFRGDNPELLLGLTTSQAIALFLMIPAGAWLLMLAQDKKEIDHAGC